LSQAPPRVRAVFLTVVYGLAAGSVAVIFHLGIDFVYQRGLVSLAGHSAWEFLAGSFFLLVGSGAMVGWLLTKFCPEAAGSGIPQLKIAFWRDFGCVPFRVVWVKLAAGIISIGGGASLGREGPSVQLASGLASNLAAQLGEAKQARRGPAAAGAAAGLAAAFNTPLAAVTFVLEEIVGDLNSRLLGSVLLASVIGALVAHGLLGPQPAFELRPVGAIQWRAYLAAPVVAALAGLVGVAFQKLSLDLRQWFRLQKAFPAWAGPAVAGMITWALGSVVFLGWGRLGVFSLGYEDLSDGLRGELPVRLVLALLAAKFLATIVCYGLGGSGGIFSPNLFLGGMCGLLVSSAARLATHLDGGESTALAVVGMSACLGAVVRAPVTGILIVFEMTHEFSLVPPLMIGALVSQAISRKLCRHNFYDEILERDGCAVERLLPPRDLRSWHHLPIAAIANFHPITVEYLDPTSLRATLGKSPHRCFPVVQGGRIVGMLARDVAQKVVDRGGEPRLDPPLIVSPKESIRRVQARLIESSSGVALIAEHGDSKVLGIVTLHDLLRAEFAAADQAD
jgi:chloride channel protein, CIC family